MKPVFYIAVCLTALGSFAAYAGEADVIDAKAISIGGDEWRVDATLAHADTGWDHYANAFIVLTPEGETLGTRVLYHPHVHEQPFTRSLTVSVPPGLNEIVIRAVDSVHETGGADYIIMLKSGR